FTVTATSTTDPTISGSASGTLNVSAAGVAVSVPNTAAPNSTITVQVTNQGSTDDTFTLALGGPAALDATLGQMQVPVPAGTTVNVPIMIGALAIAAQGPFNLIVTATSHADPTVVGSASTSVMVPATTGVTAAFSPSVQVLPVPGTTSFLLQVNN